MTLAARRIFASQFSFDKRTKIWTADRSDLGNNLAGRVWKGKSDLGFVMVSERTKNEILCLWSGDRRDQEGELLWDVFLCYDVAGRPLTGDLAGAEVRVFND